MSADGQPSRDFGLPVPVFGRAPSLALMPAQEAIGVAPAATVRKLQRKLAGDKKKKAEMHVRVDEFVAMASWQVPVEAGELASAVADGQGKLRKVKGWGAVQPAVDVQLIVSKTSQMALLAAFHSASFSSRILTTCTFAVVEMVKTQRKTTKSAGMKRSLISTLMELDEENIPLLLLAGRMMQNIGQS
jgi:hypothetical protein